MAVEKGTLAYRVLVELDGHGRPMTVPELHEAVSATTADDLHLALYDLGPCVKRGYVQKQGWLTDFDRPTYQITEEGTEALRRADVEDTRRMRRVPDMTRWERIKRVWFT